MRNEEYKITRHDITAILRHALEDYRKNRMKPRKDNEYVALANIIGEFRHYYGIEFEEDCGICSDEGVY